MRLFNPAIVLLRRDHNTNILNESPASLDCSLTIRPAKAVHARMDRAHDYLNFPAARTSVPTATGAQAAIPSASARIHWPIVTTRPATAASRRPRRPSAIPSRHPVLRLISCRPSPQPRRRIPITWTSSTTIERRPCCPESPSVSVFADAVDLEREIDYTFFIFRAETNETTDARDR